MTPLQQAANLLIEHWDGGIYIEDAMAGLREALDAEIAQSVEPVAWYARRFDDFMSRERYAEHKRLDTYTHRSGDFDTPLYLHPPQPQATYGWLEAVDKELVCTHLGIANLSDTFDEANAKLLALINWHVAVALDPSVNGGLSLQPQATTPSIRQHCSECANWAKAVADTKEWADGVKIGREIIKKLAAAQGEKP